MRIKDFEIKNLYGKYSFRHNLDEKVNIIVGNNGTFKTTLLRILKYVVFYQSTSHFFDIDTTKINFKDNLSIEYTEYMSPLSELEKANIDDKDFRKSIEQIAQQTRDVKDKSKVTVNYNVWLPCINNEEITETDYRKQVKLDYISTFDIKDKDINTQETYLDKRLVQLQSDYGYYLNGLQKQFTSYLNKQGSVTKEVYDKIYTRKTLFENLVNGAFKETGKVIDNESEKLRFIIDGKTSIEASQLSSGEKQLLIILLTVLLEDGREYVLMMDEPEISLHISWQYELLNWILELNPNVQLILTTHSPSIFSDGWGDKAIYMEDITTKK